MFELYDRVLDKKTGKPCFVIVVDDSVEGDIVYGLEAEDQSDEKWFRWAGADELEKLPEHGGVKEA